MSWPGLVLRQVRYNFTTFRRNPASAFFTLVFPIMLLVIFNLVFGNGHTSVQGHLVSQATFYVPGITAFAVISACYTNLAMSIAIRRETGLLKRVRSTPLPGWAYLVGLILNSMLIALILVALFTVFGRVFYSVELPSRTLAAFVVDVLVGAATFCALGLAVSTLIPNEDAAPAITNVTIFPLLFISDVFISLDVAPSWVKTLANFFPVRHFADSLLTAFNPFTTGSGFVGNDLLVMVVWGAAALVFALTRFRWEPSA